MNKGISASFDAIFVQLCTKSSGLERVFLPAPKVTPDKAKDFWKSQFVFSFGNCTHANW